MARNCDVIVFGATGYTGRLVAEHMFKTYGANGPVKWAMAGRSQVKLEEVRAEIGAPASVPLVVADSNNAASLAAMAEQTKALITTAGPYQLYGDGVVAACAKAGTDYVDLTGESNWIADKMRDHDAEAKASGARLVFSCGFDSIPFDVGVYFAQEEARKQFGAYAPRVRARVRSLRGGISGGSLASGIATQAAMQKHPAIVGVLMNPFALTPGFIRARTARREHALRRQGRRLMGWPVHDGRDQHEGRPPRQFPARPSLGQGFQIRRDDDDRRPAGASRPELRHGQYAEARRRPDQEGT